MTGGLDTGERAALEELRDVVRFDVLTDSEPAALLSRSHDNIISVPKWGGRYSGDGLHPTTSTPLRRSPSGYSASATATGKSPAVRLDIHPHRPDSRHEHRTCGRLVSVL